MNKRVKSTNIESLLSVDIETAARSKVLDPKSKEFQLYQWRLRDKDTGKFPPVKEVQESYKRNAALYPQYNAIVCISVAYVRNGTAYIKSFTGDQKSIIERFYEVLNSSGLIPLGHNIIAFDMPTIRIKALESGVTTMVNDKFNDSQSKPWVLSESLVDTMDIIKGTYYTPISLDDACHMFGVESPKEGGFNGAEVSKAYHSGKIKEIAEYCNRDVLAALRLFLKVSYSDYKITEVVIRDEEEAEPLQEKTPLIERIFSKCQIDPEDFDEIMKIAKGKSDGDKEKFITILTAALLNKEKKTLDEDELLVMEQIKLA